MSARWYFGITNNSGVSVESLGTRTFITLPNDLTIVARGPVSFTSTPGRHRDRPGPRAPIHAHPNHENQTRSRIWNGRRDWRRGRRGGRYGGAGRHGRQQRGERHGDGLSLEERITLPNGHAEAHVIANAMAVSHNAAPYQNTHTSTATTRLNGSVTFLDTRSDAMFIDRNVPATSGNANTNGMSNNNDPATTDAAATRPRTSTTGGLVYDPVQMSYQRSDAGESHMSWDVTSNNENTVGNNQAEGQDDDYLLFRFSPNSHSEIITPSTLHPIPDLPDSAEVFLDNPRLVNGVSPTDGTLLRRPFIADEASSISL
ncbi:uncharacterized protein DSM5745_03785 [Aspergillus mulundensis]|uniref:Uncharacterized protein n=1 Tax=Aspergillus mulundensis TaxID=1810919 RepID=A0A3D8SLF7_9EURO|nr:hypothetical protein DSM5745_03785 [Aspergillus mulundensis]RDW87143.1 hypothetical protein DSM5745_03785 [Aspergillus mulundensis]